MRKIGLAISTFVLGLLVGSAVTARGIQNPGDDPGVSGIGGVFFRADDPAGLRAWYERHLGIDTGAPGVNFFWRDRDDAERFGFTVWSVFPRQTEYFGPGGQDFMINYRVRDLDVLLERLLDEGVEQAGEVEEYWYGKFAWIVDGEGNRVELWEPVDYPPAEFERRAREASAQ